MQYQVMVIFIKLKALITNLGLPGEEKSRTMENCYGKDGKFLLLLHIFPHSMIIDKCLNHLQFVLVC